MAVVVLDAAEASTHPQQSVPNQTDDQIRDAAISGIGVVSGCEVTADTPASMDLDVAAGVVAFGLASVSVSAGEVAIPAAHATLPRRDLIVVDNAGAKSVVQGTPAAVTTYADGDISGVPVLPDLPANRVAIRAVDVPAGATSLTNSEHLDRRAIIPAPLDVVGFDDHAAKTANETRSSTSITDDADIHLSGLPAGEYWVEVLLVAARVTGSTSKLRVQFSSSDGSAALEGIGAYSVATLNITGLTAVDYTMSGTRPIKIDARLRLTETADIVVQWGLDTGSDQLQIKKGSGMRVMRLL